MKQKLQKDMQLIADLGNEYKEKERDAKEVAEEKRTYKGSLTLFKERTEEEEETILKYCEKEGKIVDDMNIIDLAIQITKNNIDISLNIVSIYDLPIADPLGLGSVTSVNWNGAPNTYLISSTSVALASTVA